MHFIGAALSPSGAKTVAAGARGYKYQRPRLSFLETTVLDKYWDKVAQFYPMWLAPNVITLLGGLCVFIAELLILFYSPRMRREAPLWVYAAVAGLLFTYQTMDGTDGKQARRTGSGSAMGHLFDHGLDSMVGLLGVTWSVDALGWGAHHPALPLMICGIQSCFFLSNLVALHSGTQQFFFIDVQESQFAIMAGLSATSVFGAPMWETLIPLPYFGPTELRAIVTTIVLGGFVQNSFLYLFYTFRVYLGGVRPEHSAGRGLLNGLHQLLLLALHVGLTYQNWMKRAEAHEKSSAEAYSVLDALPLYIQTVIGFGGLTLQLLVTTVTTLPFPWLHYSVLFQILAFTLNLRWGGWGLALATVFSYATFLRQVFGEMCIALNREVFRITYSK
eukprot:TRINITY_DN44543_c0_g1_i1.p1 TRINITY_DN44543_c0_g1~~TRINITY_DN44543_c0_g1_i1.p1  ORF type:complete len:396 (+),score=63.95 TRINITY_DN44543_c0_g1_i1:22-1188(+)